MEKTDVLAKQLLKLMGGSENVQSITHCATRLRPQFIDRKFSTNKGNSRFRWCYRDS
ncbi:PTS transporter subunit EIIB [Enterococcus avium]